MDHVVAVSMFHNEADVAECVVRHMLDECDHVVVADNNSDDGTLQILMRIGSLRLTVLEERSFAYRQAETMNRLAAVAAADGASWIVPFDADEWWDCPDGRIADVLPMLSGDMTAPTTWDMIPQPSDLPLLSPFERIVYTRPGSPWARPEWRKCAYQPMPGRILLQGNHGIDGIGLAPYGPLRIRHYPYRSFEQAVAKVRHGRQAVEAATDQGPRSGIHWRELGSMSDADLAAWWADWTRPEGLVLWQG